jgi:hypothetical protein
MHPHCKDVERDAMGKERGRRAGGRGRKGVGRGVPSRSRPPPAPSPRCWRCSRAGGGRRRRQPPRSEFVSRLIIQPTRTSYCANYTTNPYLSPCLNTRGVRVMTLTPQAGLRRDPLALPDPPRHRPPGPLRRAAQCAAQRRRGGSRRPRILMSPESNTTLLLNMHA